MSKSDRKYLFVSFEHYTDRYHNIGPARFNDTMEAVSSEEPRLFSYEEIQKLEKYISVTNFKKLLRMKEGAFLRLRKSSSSSDFGILRVDSDFIETYEKMKSVNDDLNETNRLISACIPKELSQKKHKLSVQRKKLKNSLDNKVKMPFRMDIM